MAEDIREDAHGFQLPPSHEGELSASVSGTASS